MATGRHDGMQPPRAVWRCRQPAGRRKPRTLNSQSGEGGRARLVVLAAEVGGRWSKEAADFLRAMARTAYVRRWSAILACSLARTLSVSMLERRPVLGKAACPGLQCCVLGVVSSVKK